MMRNRVLITGANGFIGQHLCNHLEASGRKVTACVRRNSSSSATNAENFRSVQVTDIAAFDRWADILSDVDTIVHLAARVHVMNERSANPLEEFRKVNVDGTVALAKQAIRAGVRRFIYLSSIKVNGESTDLQNFCADDVPNPVDPYGQSKWEAEQKLEQIASGTNTEWLVIRPTLVYGPGVRGNFLSLLRFVDRGFPLPFGKVRNCRSLVSVYNLVDLVDRAIDHPAAAGQRFLVKDPEDVSTGELVRRIARAFHKTPRLLPVPASLLVRSSKLLQQEKIAQRLFGSLVVNTQKTFDLLGWHAPMSLDCALARTCFWYENVATAGRELR